MRVSVVIPTYNRPQFVERAVKSVLGQTFSDYEILVVQNGPQDVSRSVSESFMKAGAPVRHIYSPKPCAVSARNLGASEAQGDLIAFLDDDDEWFPEKLEKQVLFLDEHPDMALAACRVQIEDARGLVLQKENTPFYGEVTFRKLLTQGCVIHSFSSVVIRREAFHRAGGLNAAYRSSNDYDFYFRLAMTDRLWLMPGVLVHYHFHEGSLTQDLVMKFDENMAVLRSLEKCPVEKYGVGRKLLRMLTIKRSLMYCNRGLDEYEAGRFAAAGHFLSAALKRDPCVGTKIRWGKRNPFWKRWIRPYAYLALSFLKSFRRDLLLPKGTSHASA